MKKGLLHYSTSVKCPAKRDVTMAIEESSMEEGSRYTVQQMEKNRKSLIARLEP